MNWNNTQYMLPGERVASVIGRCIIDDVENKPHYIIAQFIDGVWIDCGTDTRAEQIGITITHWMIIEDHL